MADEKEYTARDLDEIASVFETYASDQIACQRFHATQKAKAEGRLKAEIWNEAARILRNVRLTGEKA